MSGCRMADTSKDPNAKLWEKVNAHFDIRRYQGLVGKLIHLAHSNPDIAFHVSVLSQFMHSHYEEHLGELKRILRYIKATIGNGLFLIKKTERNMAIFTDSDWARSIRQNLIQVNVPMCGEIWYLGEASKQRVVAGCSAETEFREMV